MSASIAGVGGVRTGAEQSRRVDDGAAKFTDGSFPQLLLPTTSKMVEFAPFAVMSPSYLPAPAPPPWVVLEQMSPLLTLNDVTFLVEDHVCK